MKNIKQWIGIKYILLFIFLWQKINLHRFLTLYSSNTPYFTNVTACFVCKGLLFPYGNVNCAFTIIVSVIEQHSHKHSLFFFQSLSLFLSLSFSLCLPISLSVSLYLSLFLFISLSLFFSLSLDLDESTIPSFMTLTYQNNLRVSVIIYHFLYNTERIKYVLSCLFLVQIISLKFQMNFNIIIRTNIQIIILS